MRRTRGAIRFVLTIGLLVSLLRPAVAEDTSAARRELANPDFRVRMSAALALGKTHEASARAPLEQLLADPNPAVRSAAAAALGVLGDPDAVAALDRAQAKETSASTKAQMGSNSEALKRILTLQGVQVIVQIGNMKDGSGLGGLRGAQLADVMRGSIAGRARNMSNALVARPQDGALLQRAADKHVPVMVLDGLVTRLVQGQASGNVTVQATVEFSMRRVSDQALKGTLTGSATSVGSPSVNPTSLAQLQDQAVDGAVESALRGADRGLVVAAR